MACDVFEGEVQLRLQQATVTHLGAHHVLWLMEHRRCQGWKAEMKQIYADFNDVDASGVLPLACRGSMASIAGLREPLKDGENVLLSDGELTVGARVFQRADNSWEARSDWKFVR